MDSPQKPEGEKLITVVDESLGGHQKSTVIRYLDDELTSPLCCDDWKAILIESEGRLCLKVPSAGGAHFIRYNPEYEFEAIFGGVHGPENRPATIDNTNITQLLQAGSDTQLVPVSDSPFRSIATTRRRKKA